MSPKRTTRFDPDCRQCARLAGFLDQVASDYPEYHARPVPAFGDPHARLLVVGLAPGMHGANASGRPFTGDYAGILLYETLHAFGYASRPVSESRDDGLVLTGCRITNAVKCLPPQNKPLPAEIRNCNRYLQAELQALPEDAVIIALGRVAHESVLRALGMRLAAYAFGHGMVHRLADGLRMVDSYHCSRYNTQTRRLTPAMFQAIFHTAGELLARMTSTEPA